MWTKVPLTLVVCPELSVDQGKPFNGYNGNCLTGPIFYFLVKSKKIVRFVLNT